ncbi:MAG: hypothetical protein IT184_10410 [Acidobacteria bacterium]|nr:hypothetical protein [Acidobacteriota bacterium]
MKLVPAAALAALLFAVLATANSGGYRFGVSDQAFYVPAVELTLNDSLFPRDRALLGPQMRLWTGGPVLAGIARACGGSLPIAFGLAYAVTLVVLFGAAVSLMRGLGADRLATAAAVTLLTLRHRITKTGANSLEGYMHPRMLAFACGVAVLAAILRGRFRTAGLWLLAALVIHTSTGLWFAAALIAAWWWQSAGAAGRRAAAWLVPAFVAAIVLAAASGTLGRMDAPWLAVLADRDYLFPAAWPASAWIANLLYPAVIVLVHRRRRLRAATAPGEAALVAGLLALTFIFLVSVPFTAYGVALAVQLQVNRVFWLLDVVTVCYVGWWLLGDAGRRWPPAARRALVAALVLVAAARGYYVTSVEADRRLVQASLPATPWSDAMRWLRAQPASIHVLADPEHSLVYGASVRIAAARDTLLDAGKDPAMALYDRDVALAVAERQAALAGFAALSSADIRRLAVRYDLDVLVATAERPLDFPVAYRNDQFVVYRLR